VYQDAKKYQENNMRKKRHRGSVIKNKTTVIKRIQKKTSNE
jgi:hypothetical protein